MKKVIFTIIGLMQLINIAAQGGKQYEQSVSPVPQKAEWGDVAFSSGVSFCITGANTADADAVATLKASLSISEDGEGIKLIIGERGDKSVKPYRSTIPNKPEGYYLKISKNEVVIAGNDESGTFYGVQTFLQLTKGAEVASCEITDWPDVSQRGVIEGFYGNPWSHQDRLRQFDFYGKNKMNTYVYGPKDDPYHRTHWREPYPEKEAAQIRELTETARKNKVQFVWAVHPGGDIKWNLQDSLAIINKLANMYDLGVRTFAVFFDDIGGEGTKAEKQAGLLNYITDNFIHKHKDTQPLILCPTQYNKAWSGGTYLTTLGKMLYPEVRIMWTGNSVVDMIQKEDMEWINAQIGRKAFIWLNYPVNDYCQSRLLMGKTYGNGLDIADLVSGFCSNPMEYAEASKVSLFSIADYTWNMAAYDSTTSWEKAIHHIMPTSEEAFREFCQNNIDLAPNGHNFRRDGESETFLSSKSQENEFLKISQMANLLLADSVNNPEMIHEIEPWIKSMNLLAQRGNLGLMMRKALEKKDSVAFIGLYKAQKAIKAEQDAIVSRNYPGSIVKAHPVVSGTVITPFVEELISTTIKEYQNRFTYCDSILPHPVLGDGEYFIRYNGNYLTDAQASAVRTGDFPVFQKERDQVRPLRQQWKIELSPKTNRYKITNAQDGRYLNEIGAFWKDTELNPYEPEWHTFIIERTNGNNYTVRCAGLAGSGYWHANDTRLTNNQVPTELEIIPVSE